MFHVLDVEWRRMCRTVLKYIEEFDKNLPKINRKIPYFFLNLIDVFKHLMATYALQTTLCHNLVYKVGAQARVVIYGQAIRPQDKTSATKSGGITGR